MVSNVDYSATITRLFFSNMNSDADLIFQINGGSIDILKIATVLHIMFIM